VGGGTLWQDNAACPAESAPTALAAHGGYFKMMQIGRGIARASVVGVVILGGLSLSACATEDYVNKRIDEVNAHISAVDAKATEAGQKADAAMAAAQAAQSAANAAGEAAKSAGDAAQQANSRVDQLTSRVDAVEQRLARKRPRN